MRILLLLFISLFLFQACQSSDNIQQSGQLPSVEALVKEKNRLRKVAYMSVGRFSNVKDTTAVNNPYVQEQIIVGEPIWKNRSDAYWVHLQWALADLPEQPLADLILKYTQLAPDTIYMQLFTTPAREPNFDKLSPRDLTPSSQCGYRIVRKEKHEFFLLHNSKYCMYSTEPSPLPYFDLKAKLSPEALFFSTRYFNKDRELKIEYKNYRYERLADLPLD